MNVASLELSKELHELSGWDGTLLRHIEASGFIDSSVGIGTVYDKTVGLYGTKVGCDECEGQIIVDFTPAYDLGYLMRKLQITADWTYGRFDLQHCSEDGRYYWCAGYNSFEPNFPSGESDDSPEDAAAKLAIELFKRGVLVREAT